MKAPLTCILKPTNIVKILKRYRIIDTPIFHQSKSFPVKAISIISSTSTVLVFIDFVCIWISPRYNKKKSTFQYNIKNAQLCTEIFVITHEHNLRTIRSKTGNNERESSEMVPA